MRLSEAIEKEDYSQFVLAKHSTFRNYPDTLVWDIYDGTFDYLYAWYEAMDATGRVTVYAIREWYCTDTYVGLYLYLIDGVAVCLSHQVGRKYEPQWYFLSEEKFEMTKKLFDDHILPLDEPKSSFTLVGDMMNLDVNPELFEFEVTNQDIGKSNLLSIKSIISLVAKESKLDGYMYDTLKQYVEDHDVFMLELAKENSTLYDKAYAESKEVYDLATSLIRK